jgi:rSAM/selenodomain-associated transferase 2
LREQQPPFEVVVVDGGSTDGTLVIACQMAESVSFPLALLASPQPGRADQMNWGASHTQADLLLFLHADSHLPPNGLEQIRSAMHNPEIVGGHFSVQLDDSQYPYPLITWGINTRSRLTGIFTGDMGIFIRRQAFLRLGGYPDQPLMEDLELSRQMSRLGRIAFLRDRVVTSSRRWQKRGPWLTVALMQILRTSYWCGVPARTLAQWYRAVR